MQTIAANPGSFCISCAYDDTGLAYVTLTDNQVIAWVVDETCTLPATPIVVGSDLLRAVPPFTDPVISPRWVLVDPDFLVLVPDEWRGAAPDFFTWIATNNGAQRQVGGAALSQPHLKNSFQDWARKHPDLVWPGAAP